MVRHEREARGDAPLVLLDGGGVDGGGGQRLEGACSSPPLRPDGGWSANIDGEWSANIGSWLLKALCLCLEQHRRQDSQFRWGLAHYDSGEIFQRSPVL